MIPLKSLQIQISVAIGILKHRMIQIQLDPELDLSSSMLDVLYCGLLNFNLSLLFLQQRLSIRVFPLLSVKWFQSWDCWGRWETMALISSLQLLLYTAKCLKTTVEPLRLQQCTRYDQGPSIWMSNCITSVSMWNKVTSLSRQSEQMISKLTSWPRIYLTFPLSSIGSTSWVGSYERRERECENNGVSEHSLDVSLTLFRHSQNVFCYDSDNLRYLTIKTRLLIERVTMTLLDDTYYQRHNLGLKIPSRTRLEQDNGIISTTKCCTLSFTDRDS